MSWVHNLAGDPYGMHWVKDKPKEVVKIEITEEMLEAAKAEIARREKAERDAYHQEYVRRQREADERFWTGMRAKYPGLDQDTMYDIYAEIRDFNE